MNIGKSITIIVLIVSLMLLCACKPEDDAITTVEFSSVSGINTTVNPDNTGEATTGTAATTNAGEETTAVSTTGPTLSLSPLSTTAEIVSFFNAAANKVKQEKPGYTFTSKANADKKNIAVSDNVPFHSMIASFAASSINSAKKDAVTISKGASHDDFPVKGQNWASKLDATALTSASLKENGNYYEIELKFKDEKLPALPEKNNTSAHGKAFSLLMNEDFHSEFGGFNTKFMGINIRVDNQKFEPTYKGSTIKCKIDKAGNMVSAVYYLNTSSDVDMLVKVNKKDYLIGIKLEYSMTETYTIV